LNLRVADEKEVRPLQAALPVEQQPPEGIAMTLGEAARQLRYRASAGEVNLLGCRSGGLFELCHVVDGDLHSR
jgi:hypothetical protein